VFEGGLRHGLFHGDLHAGNLYVDDQGRIVFFDFGIMGRLDPRTRWLLRELVHALLVKKDHAAAGKIVVLMGAVGTMKPEAQAAKDLEAFSTPLTMTTLGELSYADIGRQLSTLADAYDVKLPRELVLIGKQFLYCGAVHEAAGAELADDVRPAAHRLLRQLHGRGQPRAPVRHRSLRGLAAMESEPAQHVQAISTSTTRTWVTQATRRSS